MFTSDSPLQTYKIKLLANISSCTLSLSSLVEIDQPCHVAKGMAKLWQKNLYTDVNLLVGGEKMKVAVHRIILAAQSDYFTSLFFGNMAEAKRDEIEYPDILQPNAFLLLMKYAYTGKLDIKDGKLQVSLIHFVS